MEGILARHRIIPEPKTYFEFIVIQRQIWAMHRQIQNPMRENCTTHDSRGGPTIVRTEKVVSHRGENRPDERSGRVGMLAQAARLEPGSRLGRDLAGHPVN